MIDAKEAKRMLDEGNKKYIDSKTGCGDISLPLRRKTASDGQHPYSIIVTCSDSRVIPEGVFSAGIGDLFVIRTAGNVISEHELGSIEYAAEHLGTKLIVVMGHTRCGAVGAAINRAPGRFTAPILRDILAAIGDETNDIRASILNVRCGVDKIKCELEHESLKDLEIIGAIYHIEDGHIEWLD